MPVVIFVEYLFASSLLKLFFSPGCHFGDVRIGLFSAFADFETILRIYCLYSVVVLLFRRRRIASLSAEIYAFLCYFFFLLRLRRLMMNRLRW